MTNVRGLAAAIAASCLSLVPLAAAQQNPQPQGAETKVDLPDTPVGRMTKMYFAASRTGDPKVLTDFLAKHFPSATNLDQFLQVQAATQGIDVISIESASETRLEMIVKSRRSGTLLRLFTVVSAEEPHNFRTIGVMLA